MGRNEREIVEYLGRPKASTSKRREPISTISKGSVKRQNFEDTKLLSRVVMRHPEPEILNELKNIHQVMNEQFGDMSSEALDWLLGGSSEMSRGGFQATASQTAAERFRLFLKKNPDDIPPQKLITSIETIATAMGYRRINASWVEPPHNPITEDQKAISKKINVIMGGKLPPSISEVYTARVADVLIDNPKGLETVLGEQEDVSSASEAEAEERLPKNKLDSRVFRRNVTQGNRSWIGAADDGMIHVRGHTSGTCPLALAALDGLSSLNSDWMSIDANAERLAGAVLMPTFLRGDY